jgi:hypothetical protein
LIGVDREAQQAWRLPGRDGLDKHQAALEDGVTDGSKAVAGQPRLHGVREAEAEEQRATALPRLDSPY